MSSAGGMSPEVVSHGMMAPEKKQLIEILFVLRVFPPHNISFAMLIRSGYEREEKTCNSGLL